MIPFKSKLNVSFGINWLLILSLLLASNVNCQRDGRDFTFQSSSSSSSSSSSGETFGSRDRAAYIDGNADRYNSNSPTRAQPSSSLISSSPSIVASAQFDDGESSSIHLRSVISPNYHEAKLLDERDELPERKERPAKNERVSGLDVISASRNDEDDDNGKNRKNVRSLESSSTSEPEKPTRSSGPKKSRTTRPPSPPSTSTTPSPSSTPLTTRTPAVLSNGHRVINSHPSSSSSSTSPSSSSSSRNNNEQSSSLSSSSESTESRPGLINGNFASSNVPKSTKQVNSYLSTLTRCGENITLSSLTTTIVSPGWAEGEKYPPNVECVWVITALRSHFIHKEAAIRVRVKHLEIEQDEVDCRYDYLEIRGYKKLCGFMQNKEILINASSLVIVFRTDSNNEDRGFELELYSHMEDCTPELKATSNSGEITSPGFPKNYPDSTDCWTLINANTLINSGSRSGGIGVGGPENLTISVTFDFIELEPDDQCNYDFVEFFEVDSITKRPTMSLGKFCDEKSIRKTERTIEYNPDPRVSSSHHQPSQPSTHLLITRPTNTNNHQSESLSSSSVSLSPSPVASSSSSSKSSKSPPSPLANENIKSRATINAKGPYLLVHFKSDHLLNLRGFKAAYKVETDLSRSSLSNCDWAPDESSMTLTSPQHPKPYPPNKDCSLILKAPRSDQKIVLLFDSFLMEIDNNCTFDRLEIYDDFAFLQSDSNDKNKAQTGGGGVRDLTMSKVPTKVFCGHKSSKFKYLSGGPSIRLRFISDSLHEHQGFVARYKFIQGETVEVQPSKPVEAFIEVPQNASIISGSSHLLSCIPSDVQSPTSTQSPAMIDKNIYTNNYHHEGDINFNQNHKNSNKNANSKNILWFKDNQLITDGVSENGTKLLIREFSKLDVGRYTCKYGSATAEAWLKEKNTDCSVIFRKRPRDAILSEGEFTIFECNAISPSQLASKVTITWTKNGKKLVNNSRVDKLKNGYLVINGVTSEDSGHYFCVVRLEDDPGCTSQAGARLDVNPRANVEDICGQPNLALPSKEKPLLDDAGKIVGGADARKGAFPWQVMFWDVNRKSFCGGALLNERWIATAAHCFSQNKYNPPPPPLDTIVVRLGKFDQKETEDQELNTKIQDIIKHPDYNPETFDNDLALVRVRDHIAFTDYIKPVCIGFSRSLIDGLFFTDNHRSIKMGHVTGWGQLKENGPQPRFLQELRMPIVDQDSCRKATTFAVTPNMFCAGYAQEIIGDACKGDSGGPFVGLSSNRWYLIGIVSWGEGCGRTGKYGYYTKVSNYIDWVKGLIKH